MDILGIIGNSAWPTRRRFLAASLVGGSILGRGWPARAAMPAAVAGVLPQGYGAGSRSLAITRDGKTAYVAFSLSDTLLNIDLTTGEIAGAIDVSPAGFLLQSGLTALSPDERWLVIANNGSSNTMVVDIAAQVRVVAAAEVNTRLRPGLLEERVRVDGHRVHGKFQAGLTTSNGYLLFR